MDYVLGIGEYIIVNSKESRIITHALGTCVAVTLYCPKIEVGAMIHIALPKSLNGHYDTNKPAYYADVGLQLMLDQFKSMYNCQLNEMQIQVIGGAESIRKLDNFKIGIRNLEEVTRILDANHLSYDTTETGGNISRTIILDLKTGLLSTHKQPLII